MKRVGVQYVAPNGDGTYAYDVPDDTRLGAKVVDEHGRVAIVTALVNRYDGPVLEAQQLDTVLRAYRILRKAK